MTPETFVNVQRSRTEDRLAVMMKKAKIYSRNNDRLHNFKRAAERKRTTPERALDGMLAKHITAMDDMLDDLDQGIHRGQKQWEETLNDTQNYLDLLYALLAERYDWVEEE